MGFEILIAMYKEDVDFKDIYAACENPVTHNRSKWLDYMLQEGLLFKNSKLCILRCSMREHLIQEKHSGGLSRHFGQDKTFAMVSNFYFWPKIQYDVKKFVEGCRICQHAKGRSVVISQITDGLPIIHIKVYRHNRDKRQEHRCRITDYIIS